MYIVHCIYLISDEEDPLPGLVAMTVKLDTSYRELREIDDITCITHSIHMYITTSQRAKCMHMELVLTIYSRFGLRQYIWVTIVLPCLHQHQVPWS